VILELKRHAVLLVVTVMVFNRSLDRRVVTVFGFDD
jgi:hypothetical protein